MKHPKANLHEKRQYDRKSKLEVTVLNSHHISLQE